MVLEHVDFTATHQITTPTYPAWRTIGTVTPTGVVSSSRVVEPVLHLPNDPYAYTDHDLAKVRLVVTYEVLT